MASVSSLDQDMRKLRLDRYTPQAESEVRSWIERTLGETLASGDLLDALKDGVALCKLANLILPPPGIKYKASAMPFTQRENISHFLTACELDPLNLPAHDRFLTVDLYDHKDPAQVIQCIGAFSRAANAANPSKFPTVIGPKRQPSPTRKPPANGSGLGVSSSYTRDRGTSNASQGSESSVDPKRAVSPALTDGSGTSRSTGAVSSWSKKSDENTSAPAWNIHQYGYMGGASQGNQGISFGARRQITSPGVSVPSLAEKEKRRKEEEAEAERVRREAELAEQRRRAEAEDQERREKIAEEERWEQETRKAREREKQQVEEQRRRWEEEERQWKEEEERRKKEEAENAPPSTSLRGQYLSEYQSEQRAVPSVGDATKPDSQNSRIQELERQLEEAKERERQYQAEREQRSRRDQTPEVTPEPPESSSSYRRPRSLSPDKTPTRSTQRDSWAPDEREQLRQEWSSHQAEATSSPAAPSLGSTRPLPVPSSLQATPQSARQQQQPPSQAIETPAAAPQPTPPSTTTTADSSFSSPTPLPRPLPEPTKASGSPSPFTRTDRFLARNPAPQPVPPSTHFPAEMGLTSSAERAAEDARRVAAQEKTKAGGWASKSLLEREMERERERQREWEEAQMGRPGGSGRIMGPRELKR